VIDFKERFKMKNYFVLLAGVLLSISSMAATEMTKCGEYYIDRADREVFTVSQTGVKRPLGIFARDPSIQSIDVYPGYLEESILLTSGLSFSIRTSKDGSSGIMSDAMNSFEIGSCYEVRAVTLDTGKTEYE
jgi:hypothetical protein